MYRDHWILIAVLLTVAAVAAPAVFRRPRTIRPSSGVLRARFARRRAVAKREVRRRALRRLERLLSAAPGPA